MFLKMAFDIIGTVMSLSNNHVYICINVFNNIYNKPHRLQVQYPLLYPVFFLIESLVQSIGQYLGQLSQPTHLDNFPVAKLHFWGWLARQSAIVSTVHLVT